MKASLVLFLCALTGSAWAHPGHSWETELAQHFGGERRGGDNDAKATNEVSIKVEGEFRLIRANGVPDHKPGDFPNRNNPNRIAPQHYEFKVPVHPKVADKPTALFMQPFGVAVNGVVFDPFAAEWWNDDRQSMWQYEPMNMQGRLGADENNAHVQPNGAYHYHSVPTGLLDKLSRGKKKMTLVGWAADGFPMYGPLGFSTAKDTNSNLKTLKSSYRVKKGVRPSGPGGNYDGTFVADYEYVKGAGDLDECNGRFGATAEFPQGTYYYVLTDDFPFIPRFFKGTPDQTFSRRGLPPGRGPRPGNRGEPFPPRRADLNTDVLFPSDDNKQRSSGQSRAPQQPGAVREASVDRSVSHTL